jgi:hypothetical protein
LTEGATNRSKVLRATGRRSRTLRKSLPTRLADFATVEPRGRHPEPLDKDREGWIPVPPNHMVLAQAGQAIEIADRPRRAHRGGVIFHVIVVVGRAKAATPPAIRHALRSAVPTRAR